MFILYHGLSLQPDTKPQDMAKQEKKRYRKSRPKAAVLILYLIALGSSAYLVFDWWMEKRTGFAKYPGFGISIPTDFEVVGIDVSRHQGRIRWESVAAMREKSIRLSFAFIKATEGFSLKDPEFSRNWRQAEKAGMIRGAYHFFIPYRSGKEQARHFISNVSLKKGDLAPVLDVEETYGTPAQTVRGRVKEWLAEVERHYGIRPIIYTNASFYEDVLGSEFDGYPLWVAHYLKRDKPRIDRDWSFWQFSETGRVNGVLERVDFNVFNGDSSDMLDLRKR